jgi:hypothetical protein
MTLVQIQIGTRNTRTEAKRMFTTGQIPSRTLRTHVTHPFANVLGDLPVNKEDYVNKHHFTQAQERGRAGNCISIWYLPCKTPNCFQNRRIGP